MGSCVSSAVRASLNLASWNCQLELSVGSWRSAGSGRWCVGLRVLYNLCFVRPIMRDGEMRMEGARRI